MNLPVPLLPLPAVNANPPSAAMGLASLDREEISPVPVLHLALTSRLLTAREPASTENEIVNVSPSHSAVPDQSPVRSYSWASASFCEGIRTLDAASWTTGWGSGIVGGGSWITGGGSWMTGGGNWITGGGSWTTGGGSWTTGSGTCTCVISRCVTGVGISTSRGIAALPLRGSRKTMSGKSPIFTASSVRSGGIDKRNENRIRNWLYSRI